MTKRKQLTLSTRHRDDEPEYGPAMKAISVPWQRLVEASFLVKPGHGMWVAAGRAAGFGNPNNPDENALRVTVHRIKSDERFIAALKEQAAKYLQAGSPAAIQALLNVVHNPHHRDHVKAAVTLLDRVMPVQTSHKVEVTHKNQFQTDEDFLGALRRLREFDVPRAKLLEVFGDKLEHFERKLGLPVIEAEFSDVTEPQPDDTIPEKW
jgi:hypothetical protein